ncbi:MAG: hypothetical protein AAF430_17115 [Myxococcota bacterium]
MLRALVIGIAALLLSGCPFAGTTQLDLRPSTSPLPEPEPINRPGDLVLENTGFVFPERYGDFIRVAALRFDTAGLDLSVGYNYRTAGCLIAATVFVYPTPRMQFVGASSEVIESVQARWISEEFTARVAEIRAHHPDITSELTYEAHLPYRGTALTGPGFFFEARTNRSEMSLFVHDARWFIKPRFTYPASCREQARGLIDSFLRKLPWAAA